MDAVSSLSNVLTTVAYLLAIWQGAWIALTVRYLGNSAALKRIASLQKKTYIGST